MDSTFPLDESILALFPAGSAVLSAVAHGHSLWTVTGKINIRYPDGDLANNGHGRTMLLGEFTALEALNRLAPSSVSRPLSWGKYVSALPDTYFLVEDFCKIDTALPSPSELTRRVLHIHRVTSPDGLFGFPVATFCGIVPHLNSWESSWSTFFAQHLRETVSMDRRTNGDWPELTLAAERLLTLVVPRLLDPLQQGNQPIVPRLIHGDLWNGNVGRDAETGQLVFVDAGSLYAHNELEVGSFRRYGKQNFGQSYVEDYKKAFPPSHPQDEFDDRHRLYSLKYDLGHSAGNAGNDSRKV
ncbi:hypothetical protein S40293_05510 [Stachybotrys chartarum IBT 40293]|nr:hypothetical protein S40293_05510 [Stachybotrys chartarum IBT 40293]